MRAQESIGAKREPFDQQAADRLREKIIAGELEAGARLTETALAEEIGVSRSTMRTALLHLVAEGLVVRQAFSAWKVAPLTADDAWEVTTLRRGFDGLAAELAAVRIDDAGRSAMRAAIADIQDLVHGPDRLALTYADAAFHRLIVELSGHDRLIRQHRLISGAALYYIARMDTNLLFADEDEFVAGHQAIADAISSGDARRARAEAERHVEEYGRLLTDRPLSLCGEGAGSDLDASGA